MEYSIVETCMVWNNLSSGGLTYGGNQTVVEYRMVETYLVEN